MLWFLIPIAGITLILGGIALARARRLRRREQGMVLAELRDFARRAEDPALLGELRFTAPLRSDDDRSHDTMFTARRGSHGLAFILDTSRARIRWWVLAEWFASDGSRSARFEATFIASAIPTREIQILLKASRGEPVAASAPPPTEAAVETPIEAPTQAPPDAPVDPFDVPDTTAQA